MPFIDEILLSLSALFIVAGVIGCLLPGVPGPPLSLIAVIFLQLSKYGNFTITMMAAFAGLTLIAVFLDYILPLIGTKTMGGSKRGIFGAAIGLILGLIFFPPLGLFIGPFLGAIAGEMTTGKKFTKSLTSSFGSVLGFLAGTMVKFMVSGIMLFYYIMELSRYFNYDVKPVIAI